MFCSATPTLDADAAEARKLKQAFGAPLVSFGPHASAAPRASMERAPDVDAMIVGEPEDAVLALAGLESFDQADRIDSLTIRRGGTVLAHRALGSYVGLRGHAHTRRGTCCRSIAIACRSRTRGT